MMPLLFTGCAGMLELMEVNNSPAPAAPFGIPDDTSKYTSGGYESVMYVYYCYSNQYVSVSYSKG